MTRTKLVFALTAAVGAAAVACTPPVVVTSPPASVAIQEFEVAGIPVIFKPVAGNDVIAVRAYLKGGSANLRPEVAGIETFLGAVARKGTSKYTKDQFAQISSRIGASFGGSAEYDWSVLSAQGVRQHWDQLWDLFAEMTVHPTFPAAEVEIARGQILNGVKQIQDNPDQYLSKLGDSLIYAGHAYSVRPGGTESSVAAITRDALVQWHRDRLTKENLLLVVVGNIARANLEAKIASAFGGLPATGGTAVALTPPRDIQRDVLVINRQLPTNYIAGFYRAPPPNHPDYPAFVVATNILSDRLFEEVRTKRNLSYAAAAGLASRRSNYGQLYVTTVQPDSALRVMIEEVRKMQREPVPADQLAEAINVLLTTYWLRNETNMNQAAQLGFFELAGDGWQNVALYPGRLRAVTSADIQRVATQYLRNAQFVVIGDPTRITRELFTSM